MSEVHDTIACALDKFERQPEEGHKYGYHTVLDGEHCYCLIGAVASCASGQPLDYYERELEKKGEAGVQIAKALYEALPRSFRERWARRPCAPLDTDLNIHCSAVEDYNDAVFLTGEPKLARSKRACMAVLRRAEAATRA